MRTISSALFDHGRLSSCEEITGKTSKWLAELPKLRAEINAAHDGGTPEFLGEDKLCADMFTGVEELATCTQTNYVQRIYDRRRLKNDHVMQKCLANGGHWDVNQSLEAQAARTRQEIEDLRATR